MWHEARKQERMIRGLIVDYRRRAERRKDFYEKIKADPTQFLQLHGRPCKIHLDPAVAAAGEGPAIMMPWQGDANNLIDRFDARAHLDYIEEIKTPDLIPEDLNSEERQCNYERYRILAQNVFLGISEDKFLQQLAIEEQFGVTIEEKEAQREKLNEKKGTGVAIGYNYNDPGAQPTCSAGLEHKKEDKQDSDEEDDSDFEVIDVDLSIDVNKMEAPQAHELNRVGPAYGMAGCDLFSFLTGDADDAEHQKQLLREEKAKAMFSGRKSRRERRAHRDKKLSSRIASPPSYAAPSSAPVRSPSPEASRSPSPDAPENIEFITSFGGDDDDKPPIPKSSKTLYSDKLKHNLKKTQLYADAVKKNKKRSMSPYGRQIGPQKPKSRSRSRSSSYSRSRSRSQPQKRKSRSPYTRRRSRSNSQLKYRRSRSRSDPNAYKRSRSNSRSRNYRDRSRSPENQSSGYAKRFDNRSINTGESSQQKPVVPRYYGRRKEDKSSSELSMDSESSGSDAEDNKTTVGNKINTNQSQLRLSGSRTKVPSRETLTLKEKLKKKMQAQLARQLKADKRAEAERMEREYKLQARRGEEMRELAIKLRRKQRELRHQQNRRSSDEDDRSRSRSISRDRESQTSEMKRREKSRSASNSPSPRRIQVWEANKEPYPTSSRNDMGEPSSFPNANAKKRYHDNQEHRHDRYERDERHVNPRQDRQKEYSRSCDNSSLEGRRYENQGYDNRWEGDRNRPYRGAPRGQGHRYGHSSEDYGNGPSNWQHRSNSSSQDGGEGSDYPKRVKLVDY